MEERFYYSKLYKDIFDSTSWRLIFNEPYPIPAYAAMIYFVILTESTSTEGVLMRNPEEAYTTDQLMSLCRIRKNDDEQVKEDWNKAFKLLVEERVIDVDEQGVIRVLNADEIFGSDSAEAIRLRLARKNKKGLPSKKQQSSNDVQMNDKRTPNEREMSANDVQSDVIRTEPQTPLNEDDSSSNPLKRREQRVKTPPVIRPSDVAAEFGETYPKKTDQSKILEAISDLTEEELEALLRAARRVAKDPSKTEQNGRFAQDPIKFIRSKPWTEDDLKAAADVLWGKRESAKLEAQGDAGGEDGR